MTTQLRGTLLVLLSAIGYAFFPIFTRLGYEADLRPTDILIWRFSLATLTVWVIAPLWFKPRQHDQQNSITIPLAMGVLFTVVAYTAFLALERVPASTYSLILYIYPALVALFSLVLGERISSRMWAAILLTLTGCALVVSGRLTLTQPLDLLLPLLNATLYAVYLIIVQRFQHATTGLSASMLSISGSMLGAIPLLMLNGLSIPASTTGWISMLGIALIGTVLPIVTIFAGIKLIGAARASVMSTVEPVFTLALASWLLHEHIVPLQFAGGVLILLGVLLLNYNRQQRVQITPGKSVES